MGVSGFSYKFVWELLRLHVSEGAFNFVACAGSRLRSSPCVSTMLVDEGKHCS